jgi:protein-tyrosine phosphatase
VSDWISYEALLTEGYRRCAKLTWRYGTTYFWGAALLPKPQRKHVHAINGLLGEISPMSQELFSVLAVCTGNVCRSPAVERLLATRLGPTVSVSFAGTHALVCHPISEPMAALLLPSGVEPDSFEARRLSEPMLKETDLILSMTRAQRGLVVELWPSAVRRTFTLREFARLLNWVAPSLLPDGTPAERLRASIPLAVAERGRERTPPDEDDIVDPFRLSDVVYAHSFEQITAAVDTILYTIVMNTAGKAART